MLMSADGKITSGSNDSLDADSDWCTIAGVKEGLPQYYEIEQATDLWSLNTGRVMAKIGVNTKTDPPPKSPCSFVILDNKPHINPNGINYLCQWVKDLYIVTSNKQHPAFSLQKDNLHIIDQEEMDLASLLEILHRTYGVERITIQSGGSLNGEFLRHKLFDYIDIVVAPLLVGGRDTATLIDGESISHPNDLWKLSPLELLECSVLKNSYIRLRYKVLN